MKSDSQKLKELQQVQKNKSNNVLVLTEIREKIIKELVTNRPLPTKFTSSNAEINKFLQELSQSITNRIQEINKTLEQKNKLLQQRFNKRGSLDELKKMIGKYQNITQTLRKENQDLEKRNQDLQSQLKISNEEKVKLEKELEEIKEDSVNEALKNLDSFPFGST